MIDSFPLTELNWLKHYRIIPSKFPPINFFEQLVDPSLMEEIYFIENLTNDRLRDEVGNIQLVNKEDRIAGAGSSYVMAAFTHPVPSRFSNGDFGIYYASKDLKTAIKETVFHTEQFLTTTKEPAGVHIKRVLQGKRFLRKVFDIRKDGVLHNSDDYTKSRLFGRILKQQNGDGILYQSVRDKHGVNVAIFRPSVVELPIIQSMHLEYHWNGKKITHYVEVNEVVALA